MPLPLTKEQLNGLCARLFTETHPKIPRGVTCIIGLVDSKTGRAVAYGPSDLTRDATVRALRKILTTLEAHCH